MELITATHPAPVLSVFSPLALPLLCENNHMSASQRPRGHDLQPLAAPSPRVLTSTDQLLPLVDQVRGHLAVAHELLEAQEVQAAGPQTEEGGDQLINNLID